MPSPSDEPRRFHLDTLLAHAGGEPFDRHGAVNPPVYRASTILFPTVRDWDRSRDPTRFDVVRYGQIGTPTTFALESAIATLEGGHRSMLLPSGLLAVTAALQALLQAGDHLLMVDTAYAPTRNFCTRLLARSGVTTTFYDPLIGEKIEELFQPNTKVVFLESPGSLTFEVQDLPAIARVAHARGAAVVIDNTWATPYYLPALALGADVSVVAATKYIGGHSDVLVGTITTTEALYQQVRRTVAELGVSFSPDDAYLTLRGMRTLGIRLERHWRSGLRVAQWLAERREVRRVMHPALPADPGHAIWTRDFRGASGLFGVVLEPVAKAAVDAMLDGLELFGMGASFGGFESLVIPVNPARHRTATRWEETGPCLRFHVGLEDPADLIADLEHGFDRLRGDR